MIEWTVFWLSVSIRLTVKCTKVLLTCFWLIFCMAQSEFNCLFHVFHQSDAIKMVKSLLFCLSFDMKLCPKCIKVFFTYLSFITDMQATFGWQFRFNFFFFFFSKSENF